MNLVNPLAITLILASACTHASWNAMSRQSSHPVDNLRGAVWAGAILKAAIFLLCGFEISSQLLLLWPWLLLTGGFQALYFYGLGKTYTRGLFSVNYALVRSIPVIFIGCSTSFSGGANLTSLFFILGSLMILWGALKMSGMVNHQKGKTPYFFICLTSMGIFGYTMVDHHAMTTLSSESLEASLELTFGYLLAENLSTLLFLLPAKVCFSKENQKIDWKQAVSVGLMVDISYFMILLAMMHIDETRHLLALRQLSIPVGIAIGLVCLREKIDKHRLWGGAFVSLGVLVCSLN